MDVLANPHGVPAVLMSGPEVPMEAKAIRQALALCALGPVERLVLTPDLHVGPQVPVGVAFDTRGALVPGAIGNDVGCGMRLAVFDDAFELDAAALGARLRAVFFQGARDLRLRAEDRLAVLEHGLAALLEAPHVVDGDGGWAPVAEGLAGHVERVHRGGGIDAGGVDDALAAWARRTGERDSQLGSLGGGNHFCELQRVAEVSDGPTAWDWGLRTGALAVMVHAGSLGFGHVAAARGRAGAAAADAAAGHAV
ncbi:RtcB family protein, partial [Solirubrobacter phytolaccae]